MMIIEVLVEADTHGVLGEALLTGKAKVSPYYRTEVEFELSSESVRTVKECAERDYAAFVERISKHDS